MYSAPNLSLKCQGMDHHNNSLHRVSTIAFRLSWWRKSVDLREIREEDGAGREDCGKG